MWAHFRQDSVLLSEKNLSDFVGPSDVVSGATSHVRENLHSVSVPLPAKLHTPKSTVQEALEA